MNNVLPKKKGHIKITYELFSQAFKEIGIEIDPSKIISIFSNSLNDTINIIHNDCNFSELKLYKEGQEIPIGKLKYKGE